MEEVNFLPLQTFKLFRSMTANSIQEQDMFWIPQLELCPAKLLGCTHHLRELQIYLKTGNINQSV